MKVTRYFSYSDEKISKLYRSKLAERKVKALLSSNWMERMEQMYREKVGELVKKVKSYQDLGPSEVKSVVRAGVNSMRERLNRNVKLLVTSPPYLQAQEYIRSFKLELYWLGFTDREIRSLSLKEIPYARPSEVEVNSVLYKRYREEVSRLRRGDLLGLYDSYFKSLAYFFNNNYSRVETVAIFVGPVKIRTLRIPIDDVLREHLESLGLRHRETLVDKIVSRRLFKTKVNPASGIEDQRTTTEHLLIMDNP